MSNLIKKILFIILFLSPMGAKVMYIDTPIGNLTIVRILILLCLILYAINSIHEKNDFYNSRNKKSTNFMMIWFIYSLFTLIWAIDFNRWIKNIFFIFIGISSIFLCNFAFKNKKDVKNALTALLLGIMVQSLIGWYEVVTKDYHFMKMTASNIKEYVNRSIGVPMGMLGNPNDFATLIVFGIFISFYNYKMTKSKIIKLIYIITMLSFLGLILLSTSRANMLGFIIAIIFMILFFKNRKILLVLIPALVIILLVPYLRENLIGLLEFDFKSTGNTSENIRINIFKNCFIELINSFGFGVGAGQIEAHFLGELKYNQYGVLAVHNWWLEILTSYGIIIFSLYINFYIKLFKDSYKSSVINQKGFSYIGNMISLIMIAFVFSSFSASSLFVIGEWIWLFWAICIAYQGLNKKPQRKEKYENNFCN